MATHTATVISSTLTVGTPALMSTAQVLGAIGPTSRVGMPTLLHSDTPSQLFIDGQAVGKWMESTFRLTRRLNGRDQLQFALQYTSGDRPLPFKECVLVDSGVRRFGGVIENYTESAMSAQNNRTRIDVQAVGYDSFFDEVVFNRTYQAGDNATVFSVLLDLFQAKLQSKSVTYSPGRDGDPGITLGAIAFPYVTGTEVKNQLLQRAPGWSIWIDEYRELRLKQTNGVDPDAPFSVSDIAANWDTLNVTVSKGRMRNREYILTGKDGLNVVGGSGESHVFKGNEHGWEPGFYTIPLLASASVTVDQYGVPRHAPLFTLTLNGTPLRVANAPDGWGGPGQYDAYFYSGSPALFFVVPISVNDVVEISGSSSGGGAALGNDLEAIVVEDADSIAANGLVEAVYQPKTVVSKAFAEALGAGLIALNKDPSESGVVTWNSKQNANWLAPGMVIEIDKDKPLLAGAYTVQEVSTQDYDKVLWKHTATFSKGPGDVTDALQTNELLVATRLPITAKQVVLQFSLGVDVDGLTNTGIKLGPTPEFSIMPTILGGVTPKGWIFIDPADPPTGADLVVNIEVGGVSICTATIPAGSTSQASGFAFSAPNLRYFGGEIVRPNVTQIGSVTPGKNATLQLVLVG